MKKIKIGITCASFLLAVLVLPFEAFGNRQSIPEKNNTETETTQGKNIEEMQQQDQGEEQEIQNQATEQAEADQDPDINNDDHGKKENENGARQTIREDNGKSLENGQKVQNQINQNQESQGEQRRSRVASAVQEMLAVADRNPGVGKQIRTIAQNQNQEQEEMEVVLEVAKKRNGVVKFLIGPNYKELKKAENRLEEYKNRLGKLNNLRVQLENSSDIEVLTQQIQIMEQIGAELENEVDKEKQGISLFGWLFRWFAK
ncbi:MAG: hypothetical protein KAQ64_02225 [Candidatus Pacebacteria bacterium]|nr:hypothetical protein [Candidatus Paceibacterota bacterium]